MRFLERFVRKPPAANNYFATSAPTPQIAVDILKGEWVSRFPPPLEAVQAGDAALFEDARLRWLAAELGGLDGRHILELGALEGGHSYMLEQSGAASVVAIEANTHAFLRCLIVKELLGLQRVRFLCGDFVEYLRDPAGPLFDIGVASGVLYHMVNPAELIELLARRCRSHLFLWTHYYADAWAENNPAARRFTPAPAAVQAGFSHALMRQYYAPKDIGQARFYGGARPHSHWMYRDDILRCLAHFGFPNHKISFDEPDHPNGPAFAVLAGRA